MVKKKPPDNSWYNHFRATGNQFSYLFERGAPATIEHDLEYDNLVIKYRGKKLVLGKEDVVNHTTAWVDRLIKFWIKLVDKDKRVMICQ